LEGRTALVGAYVEFETDCGIRLFHPPLLREQLFVNVRAVVGDHRIDVDGSAVVSGDKDRVNVSHLQQKAA
jgi:hypothetical protein